MSRGYSKAQGEATKRYIAAHRAKITLLMEPDKKGDIKEAALREGVSVNAYCLQAINRRLSTDMS